MINKEKALSVIERLFPHKVLKGDLGFDGIIKILEAKAYFPRLETDRCIDLWTFCESNKFDISSIARLSSIETLGFKIDKALEESGLLTREFSPLNREFRDEVFFDISSTTLPRRLSRGYILDKFSIDREFLDAVIGTYKKKRGLNLRKSPNAQTSLDFYNRTVFYADSSSPGSNETQAAKLQQEFSSVLRAIVIAETVGSQERYKQVLGNPTLAKLLKLQVVLVTDAVFKSVGLPVKKESISADFKKSYVWGRTHEEVLDNISALSAAVAKTVDAVDLESLFQKAYAAQIDKKKMTYINNRDTVDYTSLNQALYDERSRVIDEINSSVRIDDVIRDFGGVEILKDGSNFKSHCVSPDHDDKDPSLKISTAKNVCNCYSCGFGGNMFTVVQGIKGISFPEAVDLIADKYNINTNYEFIKEQFKSNNNKDALVRSILTKYGKKITDAEYSGLLDMDIRKLKKYDYEKQYEVEKEEVYTIKQKPEPRVDEKREQNSYIFTSDDVQNNQAAMEYLTGVRGYKEIPPGMKVMNCKYKYLDKKITTHHLVGFINMKNGTDGKYYSGESVGKARSIGEKALTVLNEENLKKENPNFVTTESQWDYGAFYNDPIGKRVIENSVVVILNGTSMADSAAQFINEHKGHYSGLIILGQADNPNQKAMNRIVFGTAISKHTHLWYTDEEVEAKADGNDLLRAGVTLSERFSQNLSVFERDVEIPQTNLV